MKLVHDETLKPVGIGDRVVDFRGEEAIIVDMQEPHHSGSTGRVYVREIGPSGEPDGPSQGYYPSVYNLKWIAA